MVMEILETSQQVQRQKLLDINGGLSMDNADIKELATATWRLEKWLDNLNAERKMAAKSALRNIKKFITNSGVEVKDPLGSKFDPGLAVEVVNNEAPDVDEDSLIIVETLSPYIYQNNELIQYARVIIGTEIKEAKSNNEVKEVKNTNNNPQSKNKKKKPHKPYNKSQKKKKKSKKKKGKK